MQTDIQLSSGGWVGVGMWSGAGGGRGEAMQCGLPRGLTCPVSWHTWSPHMRLNWFIANKLKIVLDFSGTFFNHSRWI